MDSQDSQFISAEMTEEVDHDPTPTHENMEKKKHKRGVSFDDAAGGGFEDTDDPPIPIELLPPKPSPTKRRSTKSAWSRLTVKDIINSSPAEDQVETYLQRQLEEKREVTASDKGLEGEDDVDHMNHVLAGIPDEHLDNFAARASQTSGANANNAQIHEGKGGEKLFNMVNTLMKDRPHELTNHSLATAFYEDDQAEEAEMPQTSGDDLFRNAAKLFLRKSKTKPASESDQSAQSMEEGSMHGNSAKENMKKVERDIKKKADRMKSHVKGDFHDFVDFVKDSKGAFWKRARNTFLFLMLPCLGASFLCFYVLDNPQLELPDVTPNGTAVEPTSEEDPVQEATISWWFLFLGVRLVITFGFAFVIQSFLIDFCCLFTSISLRLCGSFLTLFIVQSKGWPFVSVAWGCLNFGLLYGNNDFAKHWLFWQDWLEIVSYSLCIPWLHASLSLSPLPQTVFPFLQMFIPVQ